MVLVDGAGTVTHHVVVARPAVNAVGPGSRVETISVHVVVAVATADPIVSAESLNCVVAVEPDDHVVASRAVDDVVTLRAGDSRRQKEAVSAACARGAEMLDAPIRTAAVPAAMVARSVVCFMPFPS